MLIMLPHSERGKLAKDFDVSRTCVWKALTGRTKSTTANKIRKAAFERGGKIFDATSGKRKA